MGAFSLAGGVVVAGDALVRVLDAGDVERQQNVAAVGLLLERDDPEKVPPRRRLKLYRDFDLFSLKFFLVCNLPYRNFHKKSITKYDFCSPKTSVTHLLNKSTETFAVILSSETNVPRKKFRKTIFRVKCLRKKKRKKNT